MECGDRIRYRYRSLAMRMKETQHRLGCLMNRVSCLNRWLSLADWMCKMYERVILRCWIVQQGDITITSCVMVLS